MTERRFCCDGECPPCVDLQRNRLLRATVMKMEARMQAVYCPHGVPVAYEGIVTRDEPLPEIQFCEQCAAEE